MASIHHTSFSQYYPFRQIVFDHPLTMDGDEVRGEDDITRRGYSTFSESPKSYQKSSKENSVVREHAMKRTQNAVHMYFDQARMSTKATTAQKSIASRLRGKQGRLRGTLMGKMQLYCQNSHHRRCNLDMREVWYPNTLPIH